MKRNDMDDAIMENILGSCSSNNSNLSSTSRKANSKAATANAKSRPRRAHKNIYDENTWHCDKPKPGKSFFNNKYNQEQLLPGASGNNEVIDKVLPSSQPLEIDVQFQNEEQEQEAINVPDIEIQVTENDEDSNCPICKIDVAEGVNSIWCEECKVWFHHSVQRGLGSPLKD